MKIGMRTIKTAIAVALSVFICQLFKLTSPFFAGIAAIITMQSTVVNSFKIGKNRMLGTVFGASIGLVGSLIAPENPIAIGIGIIIIITICNFLGWKKPISIATIVFLSIMLVQKDGSRLHYSVYRTIDTFVGIIIGVLINYFIVPPDSEIKIKASFKTLLNECNTIVKNIIYNLSDIKLDSVKNELKLLDTNFECLKEEIKLNLSKNIEYNDIQNTLTLFENLYNNLSIVSNMESNPKINNENKEKLEKLYNICLLENNDDKSLDNIDIVYNYHIEKIIDSIEEIGKIV